VHDDLGAVSGQLQRDRTTDARRRSGHQRPLPVQVIPTYVCHSRPLPGVLKLIAGS
jgi:hypothetical protein